MRVGREMDVAWEHLDRVRESFYVLSLDFEINQKSM
jgi:hypothetical protein